MPANKVRFAICGTTYTIHTTDSEEYVLSLAEKLDADMNQLMATSRTASVAAAAIITALSYLDELKKSTTGADNMRAQLRDYLEDAAKAKLAEEEARREVERLRREIGYLKDAANAPAPVKPAEPEPEPAPEPAPAPEPEPEAPAETEPDKPAAQQRVQMPRPRSHARTPQDAFVSPDTGR